ncbi:MAG: exosome complex protein Rrp42 [Candidatus Altiarchaeota archaeon]|nr:exosome complex protein Rrp42 [Candidatus Altiarchaeota archaeon]
MEIEGYLKKDYITNIVNEGRRADGRVFDECRKLKLQNNYAGEKAPGSCLVELGRTKILAGVSLGIGEPYSDRPKDGVMTTSTELRPMASPRFESGPPNDESIEVARVIDRGIRESGAIDTKKLLIEDNLVWIAFIDIHVIDHGGNLIDAGGIAAISALYNTRLPKYEDGRIIYGEYEGKLPVSCIPIPCTIAKIGGKLLIDPDIDEEYAMDARLTVATTDTINAMQKGGNGSFSEDEVMQAVDMSFEKGKEIRKIVTGE